MFKENSLFPWRKIRLICLLFIFRWCIRRRIQTLLFSSGWWKETPATVFSWPDWESTFVEIQVLAFTRIGDGRPSTPSILERTLDDGGHYNTQQQTVAFLNNQMCLYKFMIYLFSVPGPPVVILFPEVRTTSVRLIWQPPSQPNGIILGTRVCLCVWVCMHFILLVFIRTCLSSEWPLFTIKRWNIPEYFQLWLLTDHTRANIHKHVKTNTEYHTKIIDPVFKPYLHYLWNFGVGMIFYFLLLYVYQCCIYWRSTLKQ